MGSSLTAAPVTAASPPSAGGFRSDIEGLRGIAVLLVLIYHAGATWMPGGYVGVDVFFVLSGYLITRGLAAELETTGTVTLRKFYARRFRRLLPASTLVLLATVLAARAVATPMVAESVARDGVWAAGWLANQRFIAVGLDYLATDLAESPLQHFWSLAVEEQFYVVWPLLLLAIAKATRARTRRPLIVGLTLLSVASLAWAVVATATNPTVAYLSLPTRAWELAAGALLALVAVRLPRPLAALGAVSGLAAVVAAAVYFDQATAFPGPWALVPVAGTVAVLAAGMSGPNPLARLLELRVLQRAGKLSYSLYLWHWPVLILGEHALGRELTGPEAVAALALSWVLSEIGFKLLENPLRYAKALSARPRNALSFGATLVAAAVAVSLVSAATAPSLRGAGDVDPDVMAAMEQLDETVADALPSEGDDPAPTPDQDPVPVDANEALASIFDRAAQAEVVPASLTPTLEDAGELMPQVYPDECVTQELVSPRCEYGDTASDRTLVLFGDSHAAHWFPPIEAAALEQGWRMVVLAKGGCPSAEIVIYRDGTRGDGCTTWRDNAFDRIEREDPDLVVLANASHYEAYTFEGQRLPDRDALNLAAGQSRTTRRLQEEVPDARIVAFGVSPRLGFVAPECLARNLDSVTDCTPTRDEVVKQDLVDAQREFAARDGIGFVDTTRWACSDDACPLIVGDLLVYWDTHHFTVDYSRWLTPVVAATLFGTDAAE